MEQSRTQSSTDFLVPSSVRPPIGDRGKVPAIFADDGSSVGLPILFDIRIPIDESALANPAFAKWLVEVALLPTDWVNRRNRTMFEIFLSFYPTMLGIIFRRFSLSLFF